VCSSPRLIAAYHVLHRLLEPRHPPCALNCFKTIQIFRCLTTVYDLKRSNKSYSVLQLFPICQRTSFLHRLDSELADVSVLNRSPTSLFGSRRNQVRILLINLKELFPFPVEDIGVEPMTLCLQSRCSSQLS
jgi:hypothetical protein